MKKVKIGVVGGNVEMIAAKVFEMGLSDKIEIVQISDEQAFDKGIHMDVLIVDEPFVFSKLPEVKEQFYPKAKHSPKGHERWYKYHK